MIEILMKKSLKINIFQEFSVSLKFNNLKVFF